MKYIIEEESSLPFPVDRKYELEDPLPLPDRSMRPTSYWTPPQTQSPRYIYKGRPMKKRINYRREVPKPTVTNAIEGSSPEAGKYPAVQIYMVWRNASLGGDVGVSGVGSSSGDFRSSSGDFASFSGDTKKPSDAAAVPRLAVHIIDARRCQGVKGPEDVPLPSQLPGETRLVLFLKAINDDGEEIQNASNASQCKY